MGTYTHFDFEGGSSGASLTAANTGAMVVAASGNVAKFSTGDAQNGALGAQFSVASSGASLARFAPAVASKTMAFEVNFTAPQVTPAIDIGIATLRTDSANIAFRIAYFHTSGVLVIDEATPIGWVGIGTTALTLGGKYRVAVILQVGTTTSNGTYTVNLYAGNSTSPVNSTPVTKSTANLGTGTITSVDVGNTSYNTPGQIGIDDVQFEDNRTTEIGPVVAAAQDTVRVTGVSANPGGWTAYGAGTIVDGVNDESDATGGESPGDTSQLTLGLGKLTAGNVTVTLRLTADAPTSTLIELLQGASTVIASKTVTVSSTATDYTLTTTTSETATITDRAGLAVRVSKTA